jgi:hypothetical protein
LIIDDNFPPGFRSFSGTLLSACLFHWEKESITEEDLLVCIDDLKHLEKIKGGCHDLADAEGMLRD